jgi:sugar phosphate isomerase/epimerase
MLKKTGLVCCGWHTPFHMVQDDALAATIELNKAVGNRYVIIPGLPGDLVQTIADWGKMADFFNRLAERLAAHGMMTGYHNHHTEFAAKEGTTPWDAFFSKTRMGVVMQMDVGNALRGGADVMGVLKRYPGRCQTIHLKPYSPKAGKGNPDAGFKPLIGEDGIPWQDLFTFCETKGGTYWYIIEYESDAFPPLDAVERCLKAVKAMGR